MARDRVVWAAYSAAAGVPDPNHPGVGESFTGPMLDEVRRILWARQIQGRVSRFPPDSRQRIVLESVRWVDATTAELTICRYDDAVITEVATGRIVNDEYMIGRLLDTLVWDGSSWKLSIREGLDTPCA